MKCIAVTGWCFKISQVPYSLEFATKICCLISWEVCWFSSWEVCCSLPFTAVGTMVPSLFKIHVKWPRGVTDTKRNFECFVKTAAQAPDTAWNGQARHDMSVNCRSALYTWVHLLAVRTGGSGIWFGHTFVGFRTGITTCPIYLPCQANFRSSVNAQGGCSKKIPLWHHWNAPSPELHSFVFPGESGNREMMVQC